MSIWTHAPIQFEDHAEVEATRVCRFCSNQMERLLCEDTGWSIRLLFACSHCGWWWLVKQEGRRRQNDVDLTLEATWGNIRTLDLADMALPIAEVRNYLSVRFGERFTVAPRRLEEIVADIFRGAGYATELTAYQKDGGFDVILRSSDSKIHGVQVKRYKNKIDCAQIREFTGTLLLRGVTSGVFVTTSAFTRDARREAGQASRKGHPIELVDAPRLLDLLRVRSRLPYETYQDWMEDVGEVRLHTVYRDQNVSKRMAETMWFRDI